MNNLNEVSYSLLALLALLKLMSAMSAISERWQPPGGARIPARRRPLGAPFILQRSGVNALDTMSNILPIWTPILTGLLTSLGMVYFRK